ncbi:condensation domain-containing protein [Streptomyces sp. DSM 44915]|uniref:Condensation domain-containing protein n=1 Tax=Streptomyces chisholmiae TaxID=3075540 RepID=A0ABU2JUS3_9ACTN|nr:condensation domain-containing protein [Streptomyces sp. DSM 44915]MDT0268737.1 condensation domain-containing protein [Streptomyces sp. DSM 44915]
MGTEEAVPVVRSGPLVGAQEFEWWKLRHGIGTNVVSHVVPEAGTTRRMARRLLHEAVDPFESLRTSFGLDEEGRPRQHVHPVREFEVLERDAGEVTAEELIAELTHTEFTVEGRTLTRVGMVVDGPYVRCVVLSVSHAVIDGRGAQVLRQRLNSVFAGRGTKLTTAEAAPHPVDSALSEHSGPLSRMRSASLRFWEKEIERMPNRLFAPARGGVIERYHSEYESFAAHPALVLTGRRFQTSPAVVYTSTIVALAALISGSPTTTVRTHFAGRTPEENNTVGCYHQILPLTIDTSDRPSLGRIIERVRSQSFRVQRRYRVSHLTYREMRARAERARGASFAEGITVNFDYEVPLNQLTSQDSVLAAELESAGERELLMGAGESGADLTGLDAYLMFRLRSETLHGFGTFNSLSMSTEQMRGLLAGPEQLLRRLLSEGDVAWEAMRAMFGERVCGTGRADLGRRGVDVFSFGESVAALERHPDVAGAVLRVTEDAGHSVLVAHVETRTSRLTPEELRAHMLRQLSPAHPVVCPDRFVITVVATAGPVPHRT